MRERGGAVLGGHEAIGGEPPPGVPFGAVLVRGEDLVPPVARLAVKPPVLLLTAGRVGGPPSEPRSREITAELVARVLDAALAGTVEWERDPDFGFELPTEFPGLEPGELLTLVPRFLYARTERVYEYAAMVPGVQAALRRRGTPTS